MMAMYLMEHATDFEQIQRLGVVLVFDCRRIAPGALTQTSAADCKRGLSMWQGCFPCRMKRVLVVGLGRASVGLATVLLQLVPSRVRKRVSFVPIEAVVEELGAEHLPPALGGNLCRGCSAEHRASSKVEVKLRGDVDGGNGMNGSAPRCLSHGDALIGAGFDAAACALERPSDSCNDLWDWNVVVDAHLKCGDPLFTTTNKGERLPYSEVLSECEQTKAAFLDPSAEDCSVDFFYDAT